LISLFIFILAPTVFGQSQAAKRDSGDGVAESSPGEQSLTNIPLPIGHEAKGLCYRISMQRSSTERIEAGTAHRIDEEHIGFQVLKITTYTPENQSDLRIDMNTSCLTLSKRGF